MARCNNPAAPAGYPRLLALGDAAYTVEFGNAIDTAIHAQVLGFDVALAAWARERPGIVEWVPTFRSVTVHFEPDQLDAAALAADLLTLAAAGQRAEASGRLWTLPVCFDADCGPDLADVAAAAGLSRRAAIERFCAAEFRVFMLGFLPGFPYLGGLPPELAMPRLATPRLAVPAGSVALAGSMAAIYPWQSPGGWRLVGRTAARLFDPAEPHRPALLAPGDRIRWQAVDCAALAP